MRRTSPRPRRKFRDADQGTWTESDRLYRKNMKVGSARLFNALLHNHPRIVILLQTKNKTKTRVEDNDVA